MSALALPRVGGGFERRELREPPAWRRPATPASSRVAFAAAHVVADPLGDNGPGLPAAIDWDDTLAVRRELWSWGLGVAEAMDTAQRGMGLDWAATQELIARSAREAQAVGGRIVAGVATDQHDAPLSLDGIVEAYCEQLEFVTGAGAAPVLMASRKLAATARGADDYADVYGRVLSVASAPVILHWLGDMFDPALSGYWGSSDLDAATETFLGIVREHANRIDGVKVSLLDAERERSLRAALPDGVRLYTGDDYNYPELIAGDGTHHSHALLGAFAAIAPAAATALERLDHGDEAGFLELLEPTVPLSRHVFAAPTQYYKTGIAFLAWLNGAQRGFTMIGGLHSARSVVHLAETLRLADEAGLLRDPELAASRMTTLLEAAGATP